jgi:alanyl-tRNA synthetase
MSTTDRLYYNDSRLLEFDARVMGVSAREDGAIAITLDRTAFYPTGGGQPNDTGSIGEARVVDCIDAEEAGILHVLQGPTPDVGEVVHAKIDWLRRLDHIQQHTGQHILSSAFVKLFDAPTRSFRVLEHECEIDLELESPTEEKIEQAVDLANRIIWESRPIEIRTVTPAEAASLPLRKGPAREGELRVIEIADFDLTPCGGTHAKSTGEVGVIAVRSWERAKGLTRIQFMAGLRVVTDYRKANRTAFEVGRLFSAGREDSPALVARLIEESKKLARRVRELGVVACRVEAQELLSAEDARLATVREGPELFIKTRIIAQVFDDRDSDSLKQLALALISHPKVIAILGSRDGGTARLVFARSSDAVVDMNARMRTACEIIQGRGGGRADIAQGGGPKTELVQEAIDAALAALRSELAPRDAT